MNVQELYEKLGKMVEKGGGNLPVCSYSDYWYEHSEIKDIDVIYSCGYLPVGSDRKITKDILVFI